MLNLTLQSSLGPLKHYQLNLCILCPGTLELPPVSSELSYCIFISQVNGCPVQKQPCPFQPRQKARFTHKLGQITANCHHETKSYRDHCQWALHWLGCIFSHAGFCNDRITCLLALQLPKQTPRHHVKDEQFATRLIWGSNNSHSAFEELHR